MSGEKKVRAVSAEIKGTRDMESSPISPKEEQILALKGKILTAARTLRKNMDEMFSLTKWSENYKRLHRELRSIVFDE
jgi:hypothetical protein